MYTYDEWGNYIFHIQTGREGMKLLEERGLKSCSREEYDKHMASYRRIKEKENKRFNEWLEHFKKWLGKK